MFKRLLGRKKKSTSDLGKRGEMIAAARLQRSGYRVVAKNVRTRIGEIDLICEAPDKKTVVVVEVKTRKREEGDRPHAEASITRRKGAKLAALTRWMRRANGWEDRPVRIDVVSVEMLGSGKADVRHVQGAIDAGGKRA